TVIATDPIDESTNVAVNKDIKATFDESMDVSTISPLTFTLEDTSDGSIPVAGTVTYDLATKTATFNPNSDLSFSHPFRATVTTGVKDLAGNAMVLNKAWTFTTASEQAQPPVVLG